MEEKHCSVLVLFLQPLVRKRILFKAEIGSPYFLVYFNVCFADESNWDLAVAFDDALCRLNAQNFLSLLQADLVRAPEVVLFAELVKVTLKIAGVEF